MSTFTNLYLTRRFFLILGIVIFILSVGFVWKPLFYMGQTLLGTFAVMTLVDFLMLHAIRLNFTARRITPNLLSLSDQNNIKIVLETNAPMELYAELIDELPEQLQIRDFRFPLTIEAGEKKTIEYAIRPVKRGVYKFGKVRLFLASILGLVQRRINFPIAQDVAAYPSIIQMKQYELMALAKISTSDGIKRTRRLGHSYEFEQIKNYVQGDDFRSINWKATGRRGDIMVNQYEDERAQQIYCIIDKSRAMRMPFEEMSLLDYAINASLVISNIALLKYDRAGLITFSDKIGTYIKAERKKNQLRLILEALYRQKERPLEANYELLYQASRNMVRNRSLILLFTNFESTYALERALPVLRRISRFHLLVVVFFENTELIDYMDAPAQNIEEIYSKTIARKQHTEKQQMVQELKRYGIQSILTKPKELSINTVNKYLELKSRGFI
ncbi:DUF58 domain-containing protein [soil metagenome]